MGDLPTKAKLYISSVMLAGIAILVWQVQYANFNADWMLLLLAVIASVTQVLRIFGSTERSSLSISWMVFGFAILRLGAPGALVVILIAHLVEWVWHRIPWYIQIYNIGSYALSTLIAGTIYELISQVSGIPAFEIIAILAGILSFTFINHFLVGTVILFARGQDFSESGAFSALTLTIDTTLLSLGATSELIWTVSPIASLLPLIPLYLIYRTLRLPALERETQLDPKTGLFNARYFNELLKRELERANRYDRGLTVVMADLDLLRNINNNYGHIAGDEVLIEIANILQQSFRGYDVVARFGGEEFSILIPETVPNQVVHRIDYVRNKIAEHDFEISTSPNPINVSMSFGIAGRVDQDTSAKDIVHNADVALYQAKAQGRNRVILYSEDGSDGTAQPKEEQAAEHTGKIPALKQEKRSAPSNEQATDAVAAVPSEYSKERPTTTSGQPPSKTRKAPAHAAIQPKPEWMINCFIIGVTLVASILISLSINAVPSVDWWGLTLFCGLVLITEWFAVEVYDDNTSVSTSAAPYIAGILLFGPIGVLMLSTVIALSALTHHRKVFKRLVFNISNHILGGLVAVSTLRLLGGSIESLPSILQISISIISGIVLYLISTSLIACAVHLDTGRAFKDIWLERFRWLAPFFASFGLVAYIFILGFSNAGLLGSVAVLAPLFMLRLSQVQFVERTRAVVNQLRQNNLELTQQKDEIATLNEELLQTLAGVSDLRDPFVVGHSQHVSRYAVLIAKEMGLEETQVERLRKAGLLHDIGKLGVSEAILQKPGRLTEEEYAAIKAHASPRAL